MSDYTLIYIYIYLFIYLFIFIFIFIYNSSSLSAPRLVRQPGGAGRRVPAARERPGHQDVQREADHRRGLRGSLVLGPKLLARSKGGLEWAGERRSLSCSQESTRAERKMGRSPMRVLVLFLVTGRLVVVRRIMLTRWPRHPTPAFRTT